MEAHGGDRQLFCKLIKRQQGGGSGSLAEIDFGKDITQLEGWAQYFEDLATPVDEQSFNEEYKGSREMCFLLTRVQEATDHQVQEVNETQISKYVKAMKNHKAADIHGVMAEHLKYASSLSFPSSQLSPIELSTNRSYLATTKYEKLFQSSKKASHLKTQMDTGESPSALSSAKSQNKR